MVYICLPSSEVYASKSSSNTNSDPIVAILTHHYGKNAKRTSEHSGKEANA